MFLRSIVVGVLMLPGIALADWTLNNDASLLSFISIKKGDVAEIHHFNRLEGTLDSAGNAKVVIHLASVDTAIAIRDERMQEMLFETSMFPTAEMVAKVDTMAIENLKIGEMLQQEVGAELSLHGDTQAMQLQVTITKLDSGRLQVASYAPLVVDAGEFGLIQGVEALREVAGLPSISNAVPVTFVIVFDEAA